MVKKVSKRAIGKIHDVPESFTPVVYQKTGDKGNRPSTEKVRISGMKHFNNFFNSKRMKLSVLLGCFLIKVLSVPSLQENLNVFL